MYKSISLIFVLATFIVVESNSLDLESNPWPKLDHYLKKKVTSDDPLENIKEAESYLEQERQVKPRFGQSNKKLLAALELFIKLKSFQVGEESCGQFEKNVMKPIHEIIYSDSKLHSYSRIKEVYRNLLKERAEVCRPIYYRKLSEKLSEAGMDEKINNIDFFMKDLIIEEVSKYVPTKGELENISAAHLWQHIILDPNYRSSRYSMNKIASTCVLKDSSKKESLRETFKWCVLEACQSYTKDLIDIFNSAATDNLKTDTTSGEKDSKETINFFLHWTRNKICDVYMTKGVSGLIDDYNRRPPEIIHAHGSIVSGAASAGR